MQDEADYAIQALGNHVLLAREMDNSEFYAITGRNKAMYRALLENQQIEEKRQALLSNASFRTGDSVLYDIQLQVLSTAMGSLQQANPQEMGIASAIPPNTMYQIIEISVSDFDTIIYKLSNGDGNEIIVSEKVLLTFPQNVQFVNNRLMAEQNLSENEIEGRVELQTLTLEDDAEEYERYLENKHLGEFKTNIEQQADGITLMFALKNREDEMRNIEKAKRSTQSSIQVSRKMLTFVTQREKLIRRAMGNTSEIYNRYEVFKKMVSITKLEYIKKFRCS